MTQQKPVRAEHSADTEKAILDRVARVAHELRSPLSSIRIAYDLLRDPAAFRSLQANPDQFRRLIESFGNSVERLERQISDLLDIGYLKAGQLALHVSVVKPAKVVSEAAATVSDLASSRKQLIELSIEESPPQVIADHDRLRQVLVNLLTNAIRFSPTGSKIHVSVGSDESSGNGVAALFTIADQGLGIPDDMKESIYEPFFTTSAVDGPVPGGSGLGLTIARELVELHSGRLWFESEPGAGTRFFVSIPAKGSDESPSG